MSTQTPIVNSYMVAKYNGNQSFYGEVFLAYSFEAAAREASHWVDVTPTFFTQPRENVVEYVDGPKKLVVMLLGEASPGPQQILAADGSVIWTGERYESLFCIFMGRCRADNAQAHWGDYYRTMKRRKDSPALILKCKKNGETLIDTAMLQTE